MGGKVEGLKQSSFNRRYATVAQRLCKSILKLSLKNDIMRQLRINFEKYKERFMLKKSIVFVIVFLVVGLVVVQAQESDSGEMLTIALFPQYGTGQMLNLSPMAYPASGGGKLGIGFLNIFFGLGSYVSGDWRSGLKITALQGSGLALIGWSLTWDPLIYVLIVPFLVPILGVYLWVYGTISGFIAPFTAPKTAQLNDPRNWMAVFFPTSNGSVAGALTFTAHF